ncbi:MAG TPA: hypothetical protein VM674_01340 [Candidatus Acidoferrum sp.]|nr:hypothetical protein [Candidatus Acidoferrum sp.]
MTPVVFVAIIVELGLAGLIGYLALRLSTRRGGPTVVFGLFMLATVFGIVAIASVTFFRKAVSA